ncbi:MAG: type II toxin-antitoxin system PemK/MazF family toxin [Candidatus Coatesbacteria bacterium]|nr:type II toxin-antitoxin system PemK/MazF family toxin [Candidatus Coatesbacteria bacterium]
MPNLQTIRRGSVWLINLTDAVGHEEDETRPAVIVSTDAFNNGPAGLVVIVPTTRTKRNYPFHHEIRSPEGGLISTSYIMVDQMRIIPKDRLIKVLGSVHPATMSSIEESIKIILEL